MGANVHSLQATPGDFEPLLSQVNSMLGDVELCRATGLSPEAHGGTAVGGVCWTAEHALHGSFGQRWLPMRTQHNWLVAGGLALALATTALAMATAPARLLLPAATRQSG